MVRYAQKGLSENTLGARIKILLVMRIVTVMLKLWVSSSCAQTVRAEDYDTFWLWAGVKSQPVLKTAKTMYVLRGQIDEGIFSAQGLAVPSPHQNTIWLVYRVHTLKWTPQIYAEVLNDWNKWQNVKGPLAGIQIDFDSKTRHLKDYAAFLRALKNHLPPNCKLSITGLLDWGNHQSAKEVNQLGDIVDEIVIQTYRGRKSVPQLNAYLNQFKHLKFPFKIGLVQNGEWLPPKNLDNNPWFLGYVIFLIN